MHMPRKLMWVEYGDDEELSSSRKHPGKQSPLTRDGDGELGHVVLEDLSDHDLAEFRAENPSPDDGWFEGESDDEGVERVILVLTALVAVVGPRVHSWWRKSGRSATHAAARSARKRIVASVRRGRSTSTAEVGAVVDTIESAYHHDPHGPVLTVDEASQVLKNALTAAAFAQDQMNLLRYATIVDDHSSPALADALRRLGPGNVDQVINMLWEAEPRAVSEMVLAIKPRRCPDRSVSPRRTSNGSSPVSSRPAQG